MIRPTLTTPLAKQNNNNNSRRSGKAKSRVQPRETVRTRDDTATLNWLRTYASYDPFPPRAMRKLTYSLAHSAASSTTQFQTGAENIWNLNALFDPDFTGGTHQPYGFDQMAALYRRYRVWAVTIDIRGTPIVGNAGALALAAQPSNEVATTNGKSIGDLDEQTNTHVEFVSAAGNPFHIRRRFTIADIEGVTELQLKANVEEYGALVTANPLRCSFLRMAYANTTTASAQSLHMVVRLEYETEFYDRIVLNSSN